jgi:D-proline reductase (dithiol) PrdB
VVPIVKSFAEIETDFVRGKVLPEFQFEWFSEPSRVNPLRVQIARATTALVSTCGAYIKDSQEPFKLRKEGDSSFREIPADTPSGSLGLSHVGYDTRRALQDINVVFPLDRLREAANAGRIGSLAARHFSFMGFSPDVKALSGAAREVARRLLEDRVDLVLLVPA